MQVVAQVQLVHLVAPLVKLAPLVHRDRLVLLVLPVPLGTLGQLDTQELLAPLVQLDQPGLQAKLVQQVPRVQQAQYLDLLALLVIQVQVRQVLLA